MTTKQYEKLSERRTAGSVLQGQSSADWTANNIAYRDGKSLFEPIYRGASDGVVELSMIGRHNVQNALEVYAMGRELGISLDKLRDGLATFAGSSDGRRSRAT